MPLKMLAERSDLMKYVVMIAKNRSITSVAEIHTPT